MNTPPDIHNSTEEERKAFVAQQWACMHNCELCGKFHILHGRMAEDAFAEYIKGRKSYPEAAMDLRRP